MITEYVDICDPQLGDNDLTIFGNVTTKMAAVAEMARIWYLSTC
jgi:hypothetical protein